MPQYWRMWNDFQSNDKKSETTNVISSHQIKNVCSWLEFHQPKDNQVLDQECIELDNRIPSFDFVFMYDFQSNDSNVIFQPGWLKIRNYQKESTPMKSKMFVADLNFISLRLNAFLVKGLRLFVPWTRKAQKGGKLLSGIVSDAFKGFLWHGFISTITTADG